MHHSPLLAILLLLTACAGQLPPEIATAPPAMPGLEAARTNPEAHKGTIVRWGGTIAAVDNRSNETRIEVVARTLNSGGRPLESDRSPGRFIARITGFIDPSIYAKGRDLTVYGKLVGNETGSVGEYPYTYPVVAVEKYQLWQPLPPRNPYYDDPYWMNPYYPWWPPYPPHYRR
jgi:outer membrane lipoprotein